eukprot:12323623-Heterocapsa_arctica.AAC.1
MSPSRGQLGLWPSGWPQTRGPPKCRTRAHDDAVPGRLDPESVEEPPAAAGRRPALVRKRSALGPESYALSSERRCAELGGAPS